MDDLQRPVAGGHALEHQIRRSSRHRLTEPVAEVGLGDGGVVADRIRRTGGDHLAEVEHDDPITGGEHHVDVVLDQEHGEPVGGEGSDALAELAALGRVEP